MEQINYFVNCMQLSLNYCTEFDFVMFYILYYNIYIAEMQAA